MCEVIGMRKRLTNIFNDIQNKIREYSYRKQLMKTQGIISMKGKSRLA